MNFEFFSQLKGKVPPAKLLGRTLYRILEWIAKATKMEIVYNNKTIFNVDSSTLPFLVEVMARSCMRGNVRVWLFEKYIGQKWPCCNSLSSSMGSTLSFLERVCLNDPTEMWGFASEICWASLF